MSQYRFLIYILTVAISSFHLQARGPNICQNEWMNARSNYLKAKASLEKGWDAIGQNTQKAMALFNAMDTRTHFFDERTSIRNNCFNNHSADLKIKFNELAFSLEELSYKKNCGLTISQLLLSEKAFSEILNSEEFYWQNIEAPFTTDLTNDQKKNYALQYSLDIVEEKYLQNIKDAQDQCRKDQDAIDFINQLEGLFYVFFGDFEPR